MPKLTPVVRKRIVIATFILLVLMLIPGCLGSCLSSDKPFFQVLESDGYVHVQYEWSYKGSKWEYDAQIPRSTYEYFRSKERAMSYREYVLNPLDDEHMSHLAGLFSEQAEQKGWGEWDTITFVLSFVQSMPYTIDKVTTGYDNYPRYPIETIVDGGGDCEDASILFASLIREMGYGVVLLELEEDHHMAAGVLVSQTLVDNWQLQYPLTYYTTQDGKIYAYCETTGEGWQLGHKPDDFISKTARIIDVF